MPILPDPEKILAWFNSLYILAAVVAVVATFCIVYFGNKVTSIKDAQLKAYQTAADARIAEADAKAAVALRQAAEANKATAQIAQSNLTQQQQINDFKTRMNSKDQAELDSHRIIRNPKQVAEDIKSFSSRVSVALKANGADLEASNLEQQFANVLAGIGVLESSGTVVGIGSSSPLLTPGIHISNDGSSESVAFTSALIASLAPSNMKINIIPLDRRSMALSNNSVPFVVINIGPVH